MSELIERMLRVDVSALSDADKTLPVVDPAVRAMIPDVRMAGPAFTVVAEDDHLPVMGALAEAARGDVLVIATNGGTRAVFGELFATEALRRGLAGIVADGFCRDLRGLRSIGLPVFARGTTPRSGTTVSRAASGATISCGGVEVSLGDIVFGDDDGLLIATAERIEAALQTAEAIGRAERAILAAQARGEAVHDLTNHAEHVAALDRGEKSALEFRVDEGRRPGYGRPEADRPHQGAGQDAPRRFSFARRARLRGGEELTAILAGSPPGVLSMTGGFPNPATFPEIEELAARLVREDAAVALQYTPSAGIASVREYMTDRQEQLQGRRPGHDELIVTSGGMECIALMCQALLEPGDTVAVEGPTYLGALMAFNGAEAQSVAIEMDDDGLRVDALAERLAAGLRPKFLYTIPEYQNPTGRTLPLERRRELVELCRGHDVLIFEDVAYRELSFDGTSLPTLWSLGPDVVLQAGTFSKSFFPGVRLGWAAGPADVVGELAAAKANTDQCAGGLGQRLVEEYGRAGGFERHLPAARALYASHWAALSAALERHMPQEVAWTEPTGGFLTWVTLPEELDTFALRPDAIEAGVAYVPGPPFHVDGGGANTMRLSFSHLDEDELGQAAERLAGVVRAALDRARV